MNSKEGKKDQDKIVGRYGEDTLNDKGSRLINICNQNNLRIMNEFFQHRDIHKYIWTQHTRNLRSIIDYVITKQNKRIKIQDTRACRGATCGSDHHLVKAIILFPNRKSEKGKYRQQRRRRNKTKKIQFRQFTTGKY